MAGQPPAKPSDLTCEDAGAMAPLVYFGIVGAYGGTNGAIEIRDPYPRAEARWLDRAKFISSGRLHCSQNAAANLRNGLDAAVSMERPQASTAAIAAAGR